VGLLLQSATSQAQITLDGTIKPGAQSGPLTGPNFVIPASAGETKGNNLFHSFGQFNVPSNQTATFKGPASIANVISRVTGGEPSSIFGRIDSKTDMPAANFFLLNPSGVVIGAGASLNIGGAFRVSTAGCLRAAGANCLGPDDGTKLKFFVDPSRQSVLTADTPAAFGFLTANPVRISVEGSTLSVAKSQTLSLIGGDAPFPGQSDRGLSVKGSTLSAPGGQVQIVSAGAAGEVTVSPNLSVPTGMPLGQLDISGNSTIDVSGTGSGPGSVGSGTVLIRGGQVVLGSGTLQGSNTADVDGAALGIDLQADDMVIRGGTLIATQTSSTGRAGKISLRANTLTIDNSLIQSQTSNGGQGGAICVTATRSLDIIGPCAGVCGVRSINSAGSTLCSQGGDIDLWVGNLRIGGGAMIQSASGNSHGRGGNVTVHDANSVAISGRGSRIFSRGGNGSQAGPAGAISLLNIGTLSLTEGAAIQSGGLLIQGGNVTVSAEGPVVISSGGGISSQAFDHAPGRVVISTPSTLTMDRGFINTSTAGAGAAGDICVTVGRLTLTGGAQIASSSLGSSTTGRGGNVTVTASDSVSISGRSSTGMGSVEFINDASSGLFSTAKGRAPAGTITVSAQALMMSDGGKISVGTTGPVPKAAAGNIKVGVGTVALTGGALIDSSTAGAGPGGTVDVTAGSFTASGGSTVSSNTSATAVGGDIDISAGQILLTEHASLSAKSTGSAVARAGDVNIRGVNTLRMDSSSITTEATAANGGDISIFTAGSLIDLVKSQITTSVHSGIGTGGAITIGSQQHPVDSLVLDNSAIRANAIGGPGGNIDIVANTLLCSPGTCTGAPDSFITASSTLSTPGTIDIQAFTTNVSGTLARLPESLLQAATLLRAACAARVTAGKASSLVVSGRGGLPLEPGDLLPSPLLAEGLADTGLARNEGHVMDTLPRFSPAVLAPMCSR
jgi:filamentous hemagglutinin family protein